MVKYICNFFLIMFLLALNVYAADVDNSNNLNVPVPQSNSATLFEVPSSETSSSEDTPSVIPSSGLTTDKTDSSSNSSSSDNSSSSSSSSSNLQGSTSFENYHSNSEGSNANSQPSIQQSTSTTPPLQYNSNLPIILSPPPTEFTSSQYYNSASALGIAGSFHIVGFDTVRLNAHTNGNVLANNLYANANFGTNNISDELSYVLNYVRVNSGSATSNSHVLAVGNLNSADLVDNGNAIAINNIKLDRPKTVWKDDSLPFIELTKVKSQIQATSAQLSTYSEFNINNMLNTNGGSVDESYIELADPTESGVFNTTATELSSLRYLGVKGFLGINSCAVIINVDCEGVSQLNLPISLISIDGHNQSTSETHTFTNGRVLWNFYNYLENSGTTINASLLHASVIADGASFTASQNLNGTIIANNININAESHRDDFIGEIPTPTTNISITVNKLWFDSDNITLNSDGYSAEVQLLQDTVPYKEPVILNESNNFSYIFEELPQGYVYTVQEQAIYKSGEDVSNLFNITSHQNGNVINLSNTLKKIEPIVLPATGGNLFFTTTFGILLTAISIIVLFQTRRKK